MKMSYLPSAKSALSQTTRPLHAISNIFKCPVMSRWQSLSAWYSVITVPFTVTEPHSVPGSFPIPHLSIFSTFTNKTFCYTIHMLQVMGRLRNVWRSFKHSCTSTEQICFAIDWQVDRRGFLSEYNVLNFELSSKKTKIVKKHYILK